LHMNDDGEVICSMMDFSLTPSWSKEYPAAFSTYNARLNRPKTKKIPGKKSSEPLQDKAGQFVFEYIYEMPTWREPFKQRRCLVPVSEFVESCYRGEYAG